MTIKDLKETLKNNLTSGLNNNHFKLLKNHIIDPYLLNQIIVLEGNFNDIKRAEIIGIISHDNKGITINKITSGLLEIIDNLSDKDMKPSFLNKQPVSNIDTVSLRKSTKIYLQKKKLNSEHRINTYKREFVKFRNQLESYLDNCLTTEGLPYERRREFYQGMKSKVKIFTGYTYHIDDVMLSLSFCPASMSVSVETVDDNEKYKVRTPDLLTLSVNEEAEFVWVEDNPYKTESKLPQYHSDEIVKLIVADIINWLANEKFKKEVISFPRYDDFNFPSSLPKKNKTLASRPKTRQGRKNLITGT